MHHLTYAPDVFTRLILFDKILDSAPAKAMRGFVDAVRTKSGLVESYLALVRAIYAEPTRYSLVPDAWQNHLLLRILTDENPFSLGRVDRSSPELLEAAAHDLRLLQHLFGLSGPSCRALVASPALPTWPNYASNSDSDPALVSARSLASELAATNDWGVMVDRIAAYFRAAGTGLAGVHWFLRWESGRLTGVERPSYFDIENLIGLQDAKATVLRNTAQFVRRVPANNLLLFGTRGTGKSTMVRSLVSKFGNQGLRLVEINRGRLDSLPSLFKVLQELPHRFVLFLDDLSFDESESSFKSFKSVMEGALEQRPENVLIYATSNRRHLVPERWSDRHTPDTAEVHGQDAMDEKLSLADRFGVTVLFTAPNQDEFLAVVEHMATRSGLQIDRDHLRVLALRWVLWNNPRSGRSARQFVDDLAGQLAST